LDEPSDNTAQHDRWRWNLSCDGRLLVRASACVFVDDSAATDVYNDNNFSANDDDANDNKNENEWSPVVNNINYNIANDAELDVDSVFGTDFDVSNSGNNGNNGNNTSSDRSDFTDDHTVTDAFTDTDVESFADADHDSVARVKFFVQYFIDIDESFNQRHNNNKDSVIDSDDGDDIRNDKICIIDINDVNDANDDSGVNEGGAERPRCGALAADCDRSVDCVRCALHRSDRHLLRAASEARRDGVAPAAGECDRNEVGTILCAGRRRAVRRNVDVDGGGRRASVDGAAECDRRRRAGVAGRIDVGLVELVDVVAHQEDRVARLRFVERRAQVGEQDQHRRLRQRPRARVGTAARACLFAWRRVCVRWLVARFVVSRASFR
jgi:hypothetical protein